MDLVIIAASEQQEDLKSSQSRMNQIFVLSRQPEEKQVREEN